jgi:hypothetical protein
VSRHARGLRAWLIERDEDTEQYVVVAETLPDAVVAWRRHVAAEYEMSEEEAAEEEPRCVSLLCDRGNVVVQAPL